jgi:hypothetical protein
MVSPSLPYFAASCCSMRCSLLQRTGAVSLLCLKFLKKRGGERLYRSVEEGGTTAQLARFPLLLWKSAESAASTGEAGTGDQDCLLYSTRHGFAHGTEVVFLFVHQRDVASAQNANDRLSIEPLD